jgi:hypothetical protein
MAVVLTIHKNLDSRFRENDGDQIGSVHDAGPSLRMTVPVRMIPIHQSSKAAHRRLAVSLSVALLAILLPVASMPDEQQSAGHRASDTVQSGNSEQKASEPGSGPEKKAFQAQPSGQDSCLDSDTFFH